MTAWLAFWLLVLSLGLFFAAVALAITCADRESGVGHPWDGGPL
jgi:hypothetical protein